MSSPDFWCPLGFHKGSRWTKMLDKKVGRSCFHTGFDWWMNYKSNWTKLHPKKSDLKNFPPSFFLCFVVSPRVVDERKTGICCDQADPKQRIMAGPHTPFRIEWLERIWEAEESHGTVEIQFLLLFDNHLPLILYDFVKRKSWDHSHCCG